MGWWNNSNKKAQNVARDIEQSIRIRRSQEALLEAATGTADIAHDVTTILKGKLDDSIRQIEITARLLHDALIIARADGTIHSFNPAAEQIFGWKTAEVKGLTVDCLFKDKSGQTLTLSDIISRIQSDTEIEYEDDRPLESIRGKRKTGELFWIDGNVSQFEKLDGSSLSIIVIKDVSSVMRIQQLLVENEARYRNIFEQSFDGIVIVDNYHVVNANPAFAAMMHLTIEEIIAQPFSLYIHADYLTLVNNLHANRIQGDSDPHNYLLKVVRGDGTVVETLVSSTLLKWNGRNASLITIKDLTNINS